MARSLELLRGRGYLVEIVEHHVPRVNRTRDLFGIVDILALKGAETLAVQTTSASNVSTRVHKVTAATALPALRAAGWRLGIHGWAQRRGQWSLREIDLS